MKYRFSKSEKQEFAEKMREIEEFCDKNKIETSLSNDSYYFTIDGQDYRVSNHTVAASNRGAYDEMCGQVRPLYHPDGEKNDVVYITASKTRIIEIFKNLKAGKKLNRRGYVID